MKNTKVKALMKQIESEKIKTDSARILKYLIVMSYDYDITREVLVDDLNMKLQTVVARVSELLDLGIIEAKWFDKTKDHERLVYQPSIPQQIMNAKKRKQEKFDRWKKRSKEFEEFLSEETMAQLS